MKSYENLFESTKQLLKTLNIRYSIIFLKILIFSSNLVENVFAEFTESPAFKDAILYQHYEKMGLAFSAYKQQNISQRDVNVMKDY